MIFDAIMLLGEQHDESSLTEIEQVLERMQDEAAHLAQALTTFQSERADALAMKYIPVDAREEYFSWRNPAP